MAFNNVYKGKKVLVTGNTGFKGSWLSVWLNMLGDGIERILVRSGYNGLSCQMENKVGLYLLNICIHQLFITNITEPMADFIRKIANFKHRRGGRYLIRKSINFGTKHVEPHG